MGRMHTFEVALDAFILSICTAFLAAVICVTWLIAIRQTNRASVARQSRPAGAGQMPLSMHETDANGVCDGTTKSYVISPSIRSSAPARMLRSDAVDAAKKSFARPPPSECWPQKPLLLVPEDYAKCTVSGEARFNSEEPFEFETPLFSGVCLCRFRDLEPPADARRAECGERLKAYFHKRKRTFQVVIQGQFKREVRVDAVITGHEFFAPLVNIPGSLILKPILRAFRAMSRTIDVRIFGPRPCVYASLGGTAQAISVDAKGAEPDITSVEGIVENCSRLGGVFAKSRGVSVKKRKKMLSNVKIARNFSFNTGDVYTFDCFQHVFVPHSYRLNLGFRSVELARHLNHQPAQIMAKTLCDEYVYCFSLWHEKLLESTTTA